MYVEYKNDANKFSLTTRGATRILNLEPQINPLIIEYMWAERNSQEDIRTK
jgi:hypothetical protein